MIGALPRATSVGVFVLVCLLNGCANVGPASMPQDRLAYTLAVAKSLEEQLLLNIVRIRYAESPTFVDVSQIVAGYEFARQGNVAGEFHFNNGADSFVGLGAGVSLTEKPTITYAPLGGDQFARTLVAPVPAHMILLLIQSGWGADSVLNLSVRTINGHQNQLARLNKTVPPDAGFVRIAKLMRELQDAGAVDFSVREEETKRRAVFLTVRNSDDPLVQARLDELKDILGIHPSVSEVPISVGLLNANDGGVSLYTFSLMQMLIAQAKHVDIPPEAAANAFGETLPVADEPGITVRSGREQPKSGTVAVPYGGHWYWIEPGDYKSRMTLMGLTIIYRLLESGSPSNLPVLTIPAG